MGARPKGCKRGVGHSRLQRGFGPPAPPATHPPVPAVPTCSRRFCQRPHGLSSRMSLSSSLSSSRSRSRPRLGAGSGAAMARRAQAAALRAIRRRRRRSPTALARSTEAQMGAEPPPPRAPTRALRIGWRGRAAGEVEPARPSGAASLGWSPSGASPRRAEPERLWWEACLWASRPRPGEPPPSSHARHEAPPHTRPRPRLGPVLLPPMPRP